MKFKGAFTIKFKRYPSIENSYREKYINNWVKKSPELIFEEFVIVEKVHGANFQILIEPHNVQFAKRSTLLDPHETFYGYQEVMGETEDLITTLQHWVTQQKQDSIRVYGELFGANIQKGVDYGEKKRFLAFDIEVNDVLMSQKYMLELFKELNLTHHLVPVLDIVKGLEEALNYNTKFDTLLMDKDDNISEGVVIKPYNNVYSFEDGSPFYLKKKNKEFIQRAKQQIAKTDNHSDEYVQVRELYKEYLTENRVTGIFSQHGEIQEPSQMGEYIKLVMDDAREDFLKDYMEEFNRLSQQEKGRIFSVTGSEVAPILKKYL